MTEPGVAQRRPEISTEEAHAFLLSHVGTIDDVEPLLGGEHSKAFAFEFERQPLVLRVGHSAAGYRKDRFAHEHFASDKLPIPRVLEIGAFESGGEDSEGGAARVFALSERAAGRPLVAEPREKIPAWLDAIFEMLRALHETPAPATGFGPWDGTDGRAGFETFQEALLSYTNATDYTGTSDSNRIGEAETETASRLRERFVRLVPACPELRHVVHADVSGPNVIGDALQLTALIDFGLAMYGEPVYDLAQLVYGLPHLDLMPRVRSHLDALGTTDDLLAERLLCYQLAVCLQSLRWSAMTGQRDRYLASCEKARSLMDAEIG